MTVNEHTIDRAESRLRDAKDRLGEAETDLDQEYIRNPSTIVFKAQRSIELSAKTVYDLVDIDSPNQHRIPFDDKHNRTQHARQAISGDFSDIYLQKFVRLIMLTRIWGSTYPETEYGHEGVGPDDLFSEEDAQTACKYANEACRLARHMLSEAYHIVD